MDIGITLFKNLYSLIPMLACFTNSLQISGRVYEMVNYLNFYISTLIFPSNSFFENIVYI